MRGYMELLSPEDSKILVDLCRAGRLYDIEKWIADGKSTSTSVQIKRTPLQIAVEIGFHSLVDLLARNEERLQIKNKALAEAVALKRMDFVELLVSHGAEIRSVPLAKVLLTGKVQMISFFLDQGADVVTGAPFAAAFHGKVQVTLRLYIEYKKAHPEVVTALQEQADMALRYFSYDGDLRWISLLLWIGANPRSRGASLDDISDGNPKFHTTALIEACSKGDLAVLKKFKIDPRIDDVTELLSSAALAPFTDIIEYLLSFGAKVNDKPNGGSSALDRCLCNLHHEVSLSLPLVFPSPSNS
jgi:ankyrin repeat protein